MSVRPHPRADRPQVRIALGLRLGGAVNQGIRFLAHQPGGRGANRLGGSFVVAADLHAGECK